MPSSALSRACCDRIGTMRLVRYQAAGWTGIGAVRPDGSVVTTPWPDFGALFAEPDPLRAAQALDLSRREPVAAH